MQAPRSRVLGALAVLLLPVLGCAEGANAGRFTLVQDEAGRHWFADPAGERFVSLGVNTVLEAHDFNAPAGSVYYDPIPTIFGGSFEKWQASVCQLLRTNGFNTIGAWSSLKVNDGTLKETPILYVAAHDKLRMLDAQLPDFEAKARAATREVMSKVAHPECVIGVFLDNEMAWFGASPWDDNPRHTLLEEAFRLPADHPHRRLAMEFLQGRYKNAPDFAQVWGVDAPSWDAVSFTLLRSSRTDGAAADRHAFLKTAADAFYAKSVAAVRAELPGVLVLGTRFAGNAPDPVIEACGRHCDVVSFNTYGSRPDANEFLLARYWLLGKKPMMITEYSWRGADNTSGNPNTQGAGGVVATQKERGDNYAAYVNNTLTYPMVVGMHWFQFSDQSPQGRFDGENSNYGLVDIKHRPYADLLAGMRRANEGINELRRSSTKRVPAEVPSSAVKVTFEPGQFPNRPPKIDLLASQPISPFLTFNAPDASIGLAPAEGGGLVATVSTGASWGCGITFFGPKASAVPDATSTATDLDGYEFLVLEADMPKGVEFQIILDEAGVAAPGAISFDMSGGDDGESFGFPLDVSKGGTQTWRYALKDLEPRSVWGNQAGKRRIDLNSLKGPGIVFTSGLEGAPVTLRSLRFER
ncbi:hypothetical protein GC173_05665 [bacterium]|nr:hypothetical protein [bacterium]